MEGSGEVLVDQEDHLLEVNDALESCYVDPDAFLATGGLKVKRPTAFN